MRGGWHGGNRRVENLVAVHAAVGLGRATALAEARREYGSELLLRDSSDYTDTFGRERASLPPNRKVDAQSFAFCVQ